LYEQLFATLLKASLKSASSPMQLYASTTEIKRVFFRILLFNWRWGGGGEENVDN